MDKEYLRLMADDPDYKVEGLPKVLRTPDGPYLGAEALMFGYIIDTKSDRKDGAIVMVDGDIKMYAPLTPAAARRMAKTLNEYAESREEGAMEQLRELLAKPRA